MSPNSSSSCLAGQERPLGDAARPPVAPVLGARSRLRRLALASTSHCHSVLVHQYTMNLRFVPANVEAWSTSRLE